MNDSRQSELLEQFLAALQHDIHAAPPPDLDAGLADLARLLKRQAAALPRDKRPAGDAAEVRARVWQQALDGAQSQHMGGYRNGHHAHEPLQPKPSEDKLMYLAPAISNTGVTPGRKPAYPLTMIAAVLAMLIFAALLAIAKLPKGPNQAAPGIIIDQQRDTATPTPTPVPADSVPEGISATPSPVIPMPQSDLMLLTPTAIWNVPGYASNVADAGVLTLGEAVQGRLTAGEAQLYSLSIVDNGVVHISAESDVFTPIVVISNQFLPGLSGDLIAPYIPEFSIIDPIVVTPGDLSEQPMPVPQQATPIDPLPELATPIDIDPSIMMMTPTIVAPPIPAPGDLAVSPTIWSWSNTPSNHYIFPVYAGEVITIYVSSSDLSGGDFTLRADVAEATSIEYGDTIEGTISTSVPYAYYTFEAGEGDTISASVISDMDSNLSLSLFELDNNNYTYGYFDDDSGPGLNPEMYQFTVSAGRYGLVVQGVSPDDVGTFELELTEGN